ncbi:MAG: selenocysteine-specific translation elongation factor [Firmicutes bacterium]|nr:selenocysteine-specific translation elongation factor [Alicyclobacillaceae bacterium]MCL6496612.1 selenocysteine-specific translation elongation factor [Bacillota bacterium]
MSHPVIFGTAGHIDHGKTTLTRALTGQDTDRLPEEKARGISIDLGFAHFTLPSGRTAALIDVPGHERFVRNMVAGVHGIDAVILVVAADEGVMPQTREHLDILTLLGVHHGITVITKADLVEADWLELVEETVREELRGTFLEAAPLLVVDAVSGRGLDGLRAALDRLADAVEPRPTDGLPRLPVDRVFTVRGFGTVATGTLVSGRLELEQAVEIAPEGIASRVRGLEVHGHKVEEAIAGQRVAVNLAGVERSQMYRGQVISVPGMLRGETSLVVELTLLPSAPALPINSPVHCHLGTGEAVGRLYYYDREVAEGGERLFCEIRLATPLVATRQDRFLIRSYSPITTIGGGRVIEVGVRHRRREPRLLARLEELAAFREDELLLELLRTAPRPQSRQELAQAAHMLEEAVARALSVYPVLHDEEGRWWWSREAWEAWQARLVEAVERYHREHRLRLGLPKEQARSELAAGWPVRAWTWALELVEGVEQDREWLKRQGFVPQPTREEADRMARLLSAARQDGLHPRAVEQWAEEAGIPPAELEDYLALLVEQGQLVRLEESLYLHREAYERGVAVVREALLGGPPLTTAELRERLGTNRKVAVSFLEVLDARHLTRRIGDRRMWQESAAGAG